MNKICKKLVGVAILGSLVGMIPTAGFTAPVPSDAERSACCLPLVSGFNP